MKATRVATVIGALLVLGGVPAPPSDAQTPEELVGYEAVASGTAFTAFPSVPALLPVDAPAEATVSLATATLSSGGQGFGRASTFFPGTPIAGIRPLIEIASGTRLPLPDYPLVVESREFEPAKHNEQPGITMSSDVDPERAVALADAGGMSIPGLLTVRSSRTVSTSLHEVATVSAETTSTVTGIEIAGVVTIDSIASTSTVTADATTSSCDGGVTVEGVSVGGQPATLDGDGLHLADQEVLPGLPVADAAEGLAASGVTVRLLGGEDACTGATGSRTTAGVLVSVPLPSAGSVPPGGRLDVLLASSSASAGASTFGGYDLGTFNPLPTVADVVPSAPLVVSGGPSLAPVAPVAPRPAPTAVTALPTGKEAAYTFGGVPLPMAIGISLLAFPGGRRIRRYIERLTSLVGAT